MLMRRGRDGKFVWSGEQMNNLIEACTVELRVGGNYKRHLIMAVISTGLEEAKREGGDFKFIIWAERAPQ